MGTPRMDKQCACQAGRGRKTMRPSYRQEVCLFAILALLAGNCAQAQEASSMPQVTEQKLKLLESLLGSARFRQILEGADSEAKTQLQKALHLRDEAQSASKASDFAKAAQALDDGLKASTAAASLANKGGAGLDTGLLVSQNKDLLEQTNDYRKSIADTLNNTGKKTPETLGLIDLKIQEAEKLSAAGRHGDANKALAEGYQLAVAALTKLRDGDVVTIDLKFETPADEFNYEAKRCQSHQMLVEMMLSGEDRYSEATRNIIDYKVAESRQIKAQAESQAATGDWPAAIKTMENATEQLVRALRIGGMSIF